MVSRRRRLLDTCRSYSISVTNGVSVSQSGFPVSYVLRQVPSEVEHLFHSQFIRVDLILIRRAFDEQLCAPTGV